MVARGGVSRQLGTAPAVSAAWAVPNVALAEHGQLLVAQCAHLRQWAHLRPLSHGPRQHPGAVTWCGARRSEFASWSKARLRANVLLNEENKSQWEAAARKRDPEARRASAGQPWATACHAAGTTLEGRLSVPLLHAAACLAALDRLAG